MEEKIKKYHTEEIVLILLILATDLSMYNDDDLICFAEAIEGRIDALFVRDFLASIGSFLKINHDIIHDLETIKTKVVQLYKPRWSRTLAEGSKEIVEIRLLATKVLDELGIAYREPWDYIDNHLIIEW